MAMERNCLWKESKFYVGQKKKNQSSGLCCGNSGFSYTNIFCLV